MKKIVDFFLIALCLFGCKDKDKEISFTKHIITSAFVSEGVAIGDVNNDGKTDILAGSFWFESPDWIQHEIDSGKIYPIIKGRVGEITSRYSNSMVNHAMDVNQDGWIDFIRVDFPGTGAYWYENPKGEDRWWQKRIIYDSVGNESPTFIDVDMDGREDLLGGDASTHQMVWFKSPVQRGDTTWTRNIISSDSVPGAGQYDHGLGYQDLDQDGYKDVIVPQGWWKGPVVADKGPEFIAGNISQPCAQMEIMDVDEDGDMDVISSSAHKRGIWWNEQIDQQTWKEHLISSEVSITHGLALKDINEDGVQDIITGKRYFASSGEGEGALEPSALVWIERKKDGNKIDWDLHYIDDDSGVGLHLIVEDINRDGLLDVVTANKKGVFFFEQK